MKRSNKFELNVNIGFWKSGFIQNFHQQEKLWNHLLNSTLTNLEQKLSHHVCLSHPGWKNLHLKVGQTLSHLVFYPVPTPI